MRFGIFDQDDRDALLRQVVESGVHHLVSRFAFGDLTHAESLRSATLFARKAA
jgi:hypothetical protein